MFLELKFALRFMRGRRRSLVRFTSAVAVIGIAAGVASLIFAQALARGFQGEMQDKILANTPHISVFSRDGSKFSDWRSTSAIVREIENVRSVSPTDHEPILFAGPDSAHYAVVRAGSSTTRSGDIEIEAGAELAAKAGVKLGEKAEIIALENGAAPRSVPVRVTKLLKTGFFEYDSTWIIVSPENFIRIFGQPEFVPSVLEISVADIYESGRTAAAISEKTGGTLRVVDWQEANRPLFAALSLERKAALVIISLIIFVAVLNIATTLALLVNERRRDIAILRTCGALAKTIVAMFVIEGLVLGMIGIVSGIVVGLSACFIANNFKLISLSPEVYLLNYIPLRPAIGDVMTIALFSMMLCFAATVYPSFKAAGVKPFENLRDGA